MNGGCLYILELQSYISSDRLMQRIMVHCYANKVNPLENTILTFKEISSHCFESLMPLAMFT